MKKFTKEEILKLLEKNNYNLATVLKFHNVSKVNMICCGNSISSGYSMSSFTKPLLFRNENIGKILEENSIDLRMYHFSRAQDNNDEHIFSYLINDTKLSEICQLNRFDLKTMNATGIDKFNIDKFYPLFEEISIKDIISTENASNIIIYNGATGSFLDNVTRGGKHYLTHGIKRDCVSIEAFLKYIQEYNRHNNTNIQVYLCGAPSILKASDIFINNKLKDISKKYANVVYVENIPKKLLYKKEDGSLIPDLHYDELEYLNFNNKIIETINKNYLITNMLINIDRGLYILNCEYQFGKIERIDVEVGIDEIIELSLMINKQRIKELNIDLKDMLKYIKDYLIRRKPYDFHYAGNKNIKMSIDKHIRQK